MPGHSPAAPLADDDVRAVAQAPAWRRFLSVNATWLLILNAALFLVFGLLSRDHVFLTLRSFRTLMLNGSLTLLLAIAITILLGAGLIDISIGANLVVSSVVGATVMKAMLDGGAGVGPAVAVGLVACMVTGSLFGMVNGILVAYLDVSSLITTLGTTGVGTGIALLLTNGADISGLPPQLQRNFTREEVLGIPAPALVVLVVVLVAWAIFRFTRYGLRTLALGSSLTAAARAGIPVRRHILTLMMLGGTLAGLAGFLDISRYSATVVAGHSSDALTAITAAVIGGTLLEGGRVSVAGTVMGAGLSVILLGGLTIVGVSSFWQLIMIGLVLIFAIVVDRARARRRRTGA